MKAKKMLVTAIMCAMVSLGIGGTSSAATPADNSLIATVENTVETQEFSAWSRGHDRHRRGGYGPVHRQGGYGPVNVGSSRGGRQYSPPAPPHRNYPTPTHRNIPRGRI